MELVDRFGQVRGELLGAVSAFPEDKINEAVCGEWTIKGVLAHIAGWDAYFTAIVRGLRAGEDVPFRGDRIEEWNEALVKEREGRTWSEVRDEFEREGEGFLEEYRRVEGELWSRRFWAQRNPTPAWVVKHNTAHYQGHLDEIKNKLRGWEG